MTRDALNPSLSCTNAGNMNILKLADGAIGLFPKKIAVTLVHEMSGAIVGAYKVNREDLPEVFNKPTILEFAGESWRVTKAAPFHMDDYVQRKKLVLYVQEVELFNTHNKRSMVPTRAHPQPAITTLSDQPLDFTFPITLDEWRQIELLPVALLPVVEEEIGHIESVMLSVTDDSALLGYDRVHIRESIGLSTLNIPFYEFYQLVDGKGKGNIKLSTGEVIADGFFIRSSNYVYYGTVQDSYITKLCLQQFDCVEDEITSVISAHDLVLVDWCNIRVICPIE